MNKKYFVLLYSLLLVVLYGIILPYMISYKNTVIVILGIAVLFVVSTILLNKIIKILKKENVIKNKTNLKKEDAMKKFKNLLSIIVIAILFGSLSSCSTVPAGNVGIKFHLLGSDKGVDYDVLSPGRYWIGINEQLYLFPTQHQTMTWTSDTREGSPNDEHFDFQSKKGLQLKGNFAIEYHMVPENVPFIFETYKKGADEVSKIVLRNVMRDAINESASYFTAAEIFGEKKMIFMDSVEHKVKVLASMKKFNIDNVYLLGNIIPPQSVVDALNNKIKAREIAQQKENELRQSEADAAKEVAKARGDSLADVTRAAGKAQANKMLNASLTNALIKYYQIEKWDGKLPQVNGQSMPIIDLK